ncbi:hypothetical protein RhiirB3_448541 [Rhizophagus irregularis]|nr:hypothetical protein RhiirB3_448541 [Rhizophagus irregularis]
MKICCLFYAFYIYIGGYIKLNWGCGSPSLLSDDLRRLFKRLGWASEIWKNQVSFGRSDSAVPFGCLPKNGKTKFRFGLASDLRKSGTKIRLGGLPKNENPKIRSGGLPKNENPKIKKNSIGCSEERENSKIYSGGLPCSEERENSKDL